MAVWDQVLAEVTRPHVAYAVTGFALISFGTISLFLKEKLYIGEATVATIYGLIVGPHCLNWFAPTTWGNTDYITLELSRIVLAVQIFAVAVELPKKYMLRHWWSVTMLLLPVMAFGWLVASVFIWKLVPTLRWIEALCIAGCVTATDPVLASAVVGKGKFSRRVPGHLRNLLSAESGCNDGMAYPFVIMAVYIIRSEHHPAEIAKDFICIGVLYSCILGIIIGSVIGYGARHLIKFAERFNLIDRESFLVYYFCVAVFCAGVGTLCGVDDLLVAFGAGAAFSWDGWFSKKTEESHVSDVIDVLLNTAFFVYFGAIVPWPDFNNFDIGIKAWKLVCLALIVLAVRRIPIMLAIKPITPDIHTWREALFCGHFGPIGVGAIFMSLLARAQFETESETPSSQLPPKDDPHYMVLATIWPVTCFLVIASIIVHGSSIAVFTLGKRINNMAVTLTYTTTTGGTEPSWMSRLPRRSTDGGNVLQLRRMETEEPMSKKLRRRPKLRRSKSTQPRLTGRDKHDFPELKGESQDHSPAAAATGTSPDHGHPDHHDKHLRDIPHALYHEVKDEMEDKSEDEEGEGANVGLNLKIDLGEHGTFDRTDDIRYSKLKDKDLSDIKTYSEGRYIVIEDNEGNYLHKFDIGDSHGKIRGQPQLKIVVHDEEEDEDTKNNPPGDFTRSRSSVEPSIVVSSVDDFQDDKSRSGTDTSLDKEKVDPNIIAEAQRGRRASGSENGNYGSASQRPRRKSLPRRLRRRSTVEIPRTREQAFVYAIDDTVVVENADGEILRRYQYCKRGDSPDPKHEGKSWRQYLPRFLGGKRHSGSSKDSEFKDIEHAPEDMLVPSDNVPLSNAASQAISEEDEVHVRRRLSQMMRLGQIRQKPSEEGLQLGSRAGTVRSQAIVSDDEPDDDDYVTDYENEDEDAEPETDVERHRRLAALGVISTEDPDDDKDEYADQNPRLAEEEPKITFRLPERPS